jgi:hypothetical protein
VAGVVWAAGSRTPCLPAGRTDAKLRVGLIAALGNLACGTAYTLAPPRRSPSRRSCPTTSSPRSRSAPRSRRPGDHPEPHARAGRRRVRLGDDLVGLGLGRASSAC